MIQELISSTVGQMTANGDSFSFLHAERDWQNLEADEDVFPAVYLDMPVKFTPVMTSSGHIDNTFNCTALFLYKSELDQTPGQKYSTLTKAMNAQRQFQILLSNDTDNVKALTVGECFQVQNLFDANLDGVVMPFNVIVHNVDSVCENSTPSIGSTYVIKSTDGTILYSGTLVAGEQLIQIIQNSIVTLKNSLGTTISTTDILAEDAEQITAPDATAITTDSDGNQLYSNTIPSGGTLTQVIQDSTAVLKDTLGATISTTSILAEGVADITAPDSTYLVEYVNGTDIQSGSIVSGGSVTVTVPDPIVCADTTLEVNGTIEGTVAAGSTVDVQLSDSGGVVTPTSVTQVGNDLQIVLPDAPLDLFWELNYNGTDDIIFIPATVNNVGTLTSGSGSNVGTITVSTDGVTYGALSFPFTPVAATTYYFKRSTATVTGAYTMTGSYV